MNAARGGYQLVIEEMIALTPARLPSNFPHLSGFGVAVGIAILFGLVIVITALGGPIGLDLGIEGPVRDVEAFDGIGQRLPAQLIGCEPTSGIPASHRITHFA